MVAIAKARIVPRADAVNVAYEIHRSEPTLDNRMSVAFTRLSRYRAVTPRPGQPPTRGRGLGHSRVVTHAGVVMSPWSVATRSPSVGTQSRRRGARAARQ